MQVIHGPSTKPSHDAASSGRRHAWCECCPVHTSHTWLYWDQVKVAVYVAVLSLKDATVDAQSVTPHSLPPSHLSCILPFLRVPSQPSPPPPTPVPSHPSPPPPTPVPSTPPLLRPPLSPRTLPSSAHPCPLDPSLPPHPCLLPMSQWRYKFAHADVPRVKGAVLGPHSHWASHLRACLWELYRNALQLAVFQHGSF